ncbi:synaptotagmin-4-like isoform X2 [Homarus americanus]|uniref:synaptotagmin-4-like isoform X2 n=1 Tax=Homarus americanus TaxID=6706 RepID=UPI001C472E3D|nr:synaptotagmin-4-like isoform X2 [Homarus americanus]
MVISQHHTMVYYPAPTRSPLPSQPALPPPTWPSILPSSFRTPFKVPPVSTSAVVGVSVGAALLVMVVGAVAWACYRRRGAHKKLGERTVTLRRPTAVKNPQPQSRYLKKSPSPTGTKTPPGSKSPSGGKTPPGTRTPTSALPPGSCASLTSASTTPRHSSPAHQGMKGGESDQVAYENEQDKPSTPSKEELELNERNLTTKEMTPTRLGKLHFKLRYNFDKSALVVTIVKCTDLPAKDPALTSSDPYVKLQLLPEKQHKVKTRVLRKTLNPVYDEDFTFYGINYSQLQVITLHFVVLSFDRYSRDDIIGEVVAPLAQLDLTNTETCLTLAREISPRSLKIRSQGRGELLVSLCHQPAANRLTVVVLKARNLPKMDITGLSDPYVKIYLLYNGQRVAKKKTHVKKRTLNPVFNESFVFDLPAGVDGLDSISLEFLLLDWDRVTKNEVIGRLELGGTRAACGSANHHWSEVVTSPRRQIAEWHKLRE